MASNMYKLGNIREMLQIALGRPVSRQLAWKYCQRSDFPEPILEDPVKLWPADTIIEWLDRLLDGLGLRADREDTHTRLRPQEWRVRDGPDSNRDK